MTAEELRKWFHGPFGMCGCGCPEKAFVFVRDVLAAHALPHPEPWVYPNERSEAIGAILPPDQGWAWFVMYVLADKDLTEHGGGVGASWLTGQGEAVLAAMREHGPECLDDEQPSGAPA